MTRDIKEEVIGAYNIQLDCYGVQYDRIEDEWYCFEIRNGDSIRGSCTLFRTKREARKYIELHESA